MENSTNFDTKEEIKNQDDLYEKELKDFALYFASRVNRTDKTVKLDDVTDIIEKRDEILIKKTNVTITQRDEMWKSVMAKEKEKYEKEIDRLLNNNNTTTKPDQKGTGKRFNQGKTRVDLLPADAVLKTAQVFTYGAKKYGERNWEKGMKWSNVLSSLERHFQAIKLGQDYDKETGFLHIDHILCNAMILSHYYENYMEGDDRLQPYTKHPKIGLDIDEVLADFIPAYNKKFNLKEDVESWNFDPKIKERLSSLKDDDEFWLNIPPKIKPSDIPFEPACYITARSCKKEIVEKWLYDNGFPHAPVYVVGVDGSKVECARKQGIEWYVDDRHSNFVEMNEAGILCFLMDASHNQRYDVGKRRIKSFKDLPLFHDNYFSV